MGDFVFNVKGLTAQDRAQWEKDNIEALKNTDYNNWEEDRKDRYFKNASFKNKFSDRKDYDLLKRYSPEQRDSLFNADFQVETPSEDLDSPQLNEEQLVTAFNQGVKYQEESDKLKNLYGKWQGTATRAVEDFSKIATEVSPYYKKFKGTEYLPLSIEEEANLAAEYYAAKNAFGEETANNNLRRTIKDIVSKNQSIGEKFGYGFLGMGAQVAGALISTAGMVKGAIDYIGDERNESLDNAFYDFLDHVIDNDWSRYGNDVMQYGSLFKANIEEAKETGLSNLEIIRTSAEEEGGILDNLLSANTLPYLIQQEGFTVASMLTGAGITSIGNKVFQTGKGLAMAAYKGGALSNLEKLKSVLSGIQQVQKGFNAFVVPGLVGTVEGVTEGLNTKIQMLEDGEKMAEDAYNKAVESKFNSMLQDPEELSRLGYNMNNADDIARLYKDVALSLTDYYQQSLDKVEQNAAKAGIVNFGLNSTINGALNVTLKASLQTPQVQEALRRTRLGRLFNRGDFRVESGRVTSNYGTFNKVFDFIKEPVGEFSEEYLQSLSDSFARGGAEYSLSKFLENKYGTDAQEPFVDSLADNLLAAARAAGESATDKETILSGIYGALSSGIGTITINNRRGPAVRTEDESKLGYFLRRSPITYRNPLYEAWREIKETEKDRNSTAELLTEWISKPENKAKYDGLIGTFNWAASMQNAANRNDEFDFRNSELGKIINDVMMLNKLEGTDYYNSFMQDLVRAANAEEGTDEANALIQQFKKDINNNDTKQSDSEILENIKKNANNMLDYMSRIKEEYDALDNMFGNAADEDTKQSLIYSKLMSEKWKDRADKLESEISNITFANASSSNLNVRQKNLLIKYGSLKNANNAYLKLQEQISKLKEDIKNSENRKSLKTEEAELIKRKKAQIKTLEKEAKSIAEVGESMEEAAILSESEIMTLNPVDRAIMLNPENKSKYSPDQQAVIDRIMEEGTARYNNFSEKIQDAGRMNLARTAYLTQYNSILKSPDNFNAYSNRIKQKVAIDNAKKKYEHLNNIKDYKSFIDNLDKAYRDASVLERKVISSILKDNDNYKKYIEQNKELDELFNQLNSNDKFTSMEENDKNIIRATMQYLNDKGIKPISNEAIETLMSVDEGGNYDILKFIDEYNSTLPEDRQIVPYNIEETVSLYKDIVDSYIKNAREVEKVNRPVEVINGDSKSEPPAQVEPKVYPGIFGTAAKTKEENESRMQKEGTIEVENKHNNITDKYRTNSTDEIADFIDSALSNIDGLNSLYDDVKEEAYKILSDLGDSEYSDLKDLIYTLTQKSNQLNTESESDGDSNAKLSYILNRLTILESSSKPKETQKKEMNKPNTEASPVTEDKVANNPKISTANVDKYPNSTLGKAYNDYKIDEFLRSGLLNPKTPIMFITDPALISGVKEEMGDSYNENDHLPIMAVVEYEKGPIEINGKHYQPIGFMPSTSSASQGAARMAPIREWALNHQDGSLIKDSKDKVITTNGYIRATPPVHSEQGKPNTSIIQIMRNDMPEEDRTRMDDTNVPRQERIAIYNKYKNAILSRIKRLTTATNSKREKSNRIHLSYVIPNMKGQDIEFELMVTEPSNTYSRTGVSILDLLLSGNTEDILNANSRLSRYGRTLEDFFSKNPFPEDLRFERKDGQLVPTKDSAKTLSELADSLGKKLGNFLNIPKEYYYQLTPTDNTLEGRRLFKLSITNGSETIELADVTNGTITDGTKVKIISKLMLDGNNFRQYGNSPFVKWQINYSDFEAKEGESEATRRTRLSNISDIFDDRILEASKESFKYNIGKVEINSKAEWYKEIRPTPSLAVTNEDNAASSKPSSETSSTKTVNGATIDTDSGAIIEGEMDKEKKSDNTSKIVDSIKEDSSKIKLSEDGKEYVDSDGTRYARVTSIIQADEEAEERFDSNSPWSLPSTNIGNTIDEFVRDFFAGKIYKAKSGMWRHKKSGPGSLREEDSILGDDITDLESYFANADASQLVAFAEKLSIFKNSLDAKGLTVVSEGVVATGTINVTDSNNNTHTIQVAGTLDLLAYDNQGNFYIYDMKTHRSELSDSKKAKYARQMSLYKKFLEEKYGISIKSLNIIPISVSYPKPLGAKGGSAKYTVKENGQLEIDGKTFKAANPILESPIEVPVTDLNIKYEKLTDLERQMIESKLPEDTEVKEVVIPEAKEEANPETGLKKGKARGRFGRTAKDTATIIPSSNNWDMLSPEIKSDIIAIGYNKESWNEMTEEEKKHQLDCLKD